MQEKKVYKPLMLDIIEVQMEKGYAVSYDGGFTGGNLGNGGSVW